MKRLVGGEYLLDLSSIELEESVDGETYTNITNAEILEQLINLKKFVPNPKMIKPAWVKLYNGETDELVVVHGQVSNVDDGEFDIDVSISGYKLKIHVEFTQAVNSDSDPIDDWYIASGDAKYLFTSDAQYIENLIDSGELKLYEEEDIVSSLTPIIPAEYIDGIECTLGYCKIRRTKENELYLVLNFSLHNTTESSINVSNYFSIDWSVPEDIAKLIVDVLGHTANESGVATAGITSGYGFNDRGDTPTGYYDPNVVTLLNTSTSNKINIKVRGGASINAGATHNYTFRLFLTL